MNEGNSDYQIVLSRTTFSSAGQNHGREKCYVARGNPLEDRKKRFQAIWASHRGMVERQPQDNPQLILDPINVDVTPGQGDGSHSSSQSARKSNRWDVHLMIGMDD